MALLKNIKYSNGTETNYHKISEVKVVPKTVTLMPDPLSVEKGETTAEVIKTYILTIVVRSYVSQDIRENGDFYYISVKSFTEETTFENVETIPIITLAYTLLKNTEDFKDAEDV